jgi:hypothetical protein
MTRPYIVTKQIDAALKKAGRPPVQVELKDPTLTDNNQEEPDIIRLSSDYYLTVEVFHPDKPMEFTVSLNESMHSGGDVLIESWDVDGIRLDSISQIINAISDI